MPDLSDFQLSAQVVHWDDRSQSVLGFTRKILNLDLRVRQIGGIPVELTFHTHQNQSHYNSGYSSQPDQ